MLNRLFSHDLPRSRWLAVILMLIRDRELALTPSSSPARRR